MKCCKFRQLEMALVSARESVLVLARVSAREYTPGREDKCASRDDALCGDGVEECQGYARHPRTVSQLTESLERKVARSSLKTK
jgi:hypothetical protein